MLLACILIFMTIDINIVPLFALNGTIFLRYCCNKRIKK
jgi:hypothetical protein